MTVSLTDQLLAQARDTLGSYCGFKGWFGDVFFSETRTMAGRIEELISNRYVSFKNFWGWYLDIEKRAPKDDSLHVVGEQLREGLYNTVCNTTYQDLKNSPDITTPILMLFDLFPVGRDLQMKVIIHLKEKYELKRFLKGCPEVAFPLVIRLCQDCGGEDILLSAIHFGNNNTALASLFYEYWIKLVGPNDRWKWYAYDKEPGMLKIFFFNGYQKIFCELVAGINEMPPSLKAPQLESRAYLFQFEEAMRLKSQRMFKVLLAPIVALDQSAKPSARDLMKRLISFFFVDGPYFVGAPNYYKHPFNNVKFSHNYAELKPLLLAIFKLKPDIAYDFLTIRVPLATRGNRIITQSEIWKLIPGMNDKHLNVHLFRLAASLKDLPQGRGLASSIQRIIPTNILDVLTATGTIMVQPSHHHKKLSLFKPLAKPIEDAQQHQSVSMHASSSS